MRRSEIFLQMVATQHPDRHWSRDLQVWVCLLPPPPLQCGQGPQTGTPWRVCHPTAARESDSSARGCWDDRISAPGKAVRNSILLSLFRQKRYIFASYLSSQVTAMLGHLLPVMCLISATETSLVCNVIHTESWAHNCSSDSLSCLCELQTSI